VSAWRTGEPPRDQEVLRAAMFDHNTPAIEVLRYKLYSPGKGYWTWNDGGCASQWRRDWLWMEIPPLPVAAPAPQV
jgi:hypothetical protein